MNMKKHFKLYKSGKNWCVIAIATLALTLGAITTANADTTTQPADAPAVTQVVDNTNESNNVADNSVTNSKAKNDNVTENKVINPEASELKTGWQKENGWTYYDNNGQALKGRSYSYLPTINGKGNSWYLVDNGVVQSGVQKWAGTYYDFDSTTYQRVDNNYVQSQWGLWYMFGKDGRIATKVYQWAGTYYYFDPSTYLRVDNDYRQSQWGLWYMFGHDGRIATQVYKWADTYYYFDPTTYLRVDNDYRQSQWGDWYMFGNDGRIVSGLFGWKGSLYYFKPGYYVKATNENVYANGKSYWTNGDGVVVNGINSINSYILSHNLGHANIYFYDNGQAIPLNIRGAYSGTWNGKPNMVVVHETANPNDSIWGEINYEKHDYNRAFVHAFVDNNNIIQITTTDHEAKGAGYPSNGRAVHFEQVEVHNGYDFARELSNAAYYTAYIMRKYGFAPSLAQPNGSGTLWSHHNVTQYLGGTDHTDPDAYWARNAGSFFGTGYNMSDFYELVSLYYGNM